MLEVWGKEYPAYPQSRPAITQAKLQVGMQNYSLQRASKYGNVCHDCAAVLELAVGLLVRNYRKRRFEKGDFHPKLKKGDPNYEELFGMHGNTCWTQLLNKCTNANRGNQSADYIARDPMVNFDLAIHGSFDTEKLDKSMKSYAVFISKLQNVGFGVDKNSGNQLTKYNSPPDIYMQKQLELKSGTFGDLDYEQIAEAVRLLKQMRPVTTDEGELKMPRFWTDKGVRADKKRALAFTRPAMQHMFFEIERKYTHQAQYTPDKQTKLFDSDMVRIEYRNEATDENGKAYELDGKKYKNCLRIMQYVPPGHLTAGPGGIKERQVYYYDDKSASTPKSPHPYVQDKNRQLKARGAIGRRFNTVRCDSLVFSSRILCIEPLRARMRPVFL